MDHVQHRLQKHLPEPVAQTLAETLVTSVQEEEDGAAEHHNDPNQKTRNGMYTTSGSTTSSATTNDAGGGIVDDDDEEWQISFVYDKMDNFVPMNPDQKDQVGRTLQRQLSLRPSAQQIEVRLSTTFLTVHLFSEFMSFSESK